MRRLIVGLATMLAAAALLVAMQDSASAGVDCPDGTAANSKDICVAIETPSGPGGSGGGGGGGGGGCHDARTGEPIACSNEAGGIWFNSHHCYAKMLTPQPGYDHPAWDGHDPDDGSLWRCVGVNQSPPPPAFFVDGTPPVVDAAGAAMMLVERAPFEVADLHLAPEPGFHTYVNVDNWVWVPESQWHDIRVSVSANGATITATARPSKLQVDMGDGEGQLVCRSAGREWLKTMAESAKSSCSYAYKEISTADKHGNYKPDGRFQVSGRLYYTVTWRCTGNCSSGSGSLPGEFPAPRSEVIEYEVRQRQTVVVR